MLCTFQVLPTMRERKSGCIINIASRAATVDTPFGMGYNCAKAAVVRATSNLQLELDDDGLGEQIHTYALHPGGVMTAMGAGKFIVPGQLTRIPSLTYDTAAHDPDVVAKYPVLKTQRSEIEKLFKDGPELCGATCAYLASGCAKAIRGLYFDCRQDIVRVCGAGRSTLEDNNLYNLKVDFLQGYYNEP
jgi:NAD(P)-dependent dehydrogenase (short-subunit alcohol dehydrogenase family)